MTLKWQLAVLFLVSLVSSNFVWCQTPSITSISPTAVSPGMQVTLTGSGFGASQGGGLVSFGNAAYGTVVSWSATQIVATVPIARLTPGNITVVQNGVSSNGVAFTVVPPVLTSISPTAVSPGMQVTLTGSSFGASQGSGSVSFGNAAYGTVVSWSATQIVATVPTARLTPGNVAVVQNGVSSNGVAFTVIPPVLTSISPTAVSPGMQMTLTGSGFGSTVGSGGVYFGYGKYGTVVSWTSTQVVVTVPSGISPGPLFLYQNGANSNTLAYTTIPPVLTSISPTAVAPGMQMTLNGSGFGSMVSNGGVYFGYGKFGTVLSWSSTQLVVTVPSGIVSGSVEVIQSGTASNLIPYTVVPGPSITSLSSTSGAVGASVTITGANFGATQGTSTVSFNGTTATAASWTASSIVATVPAGATTGNVVVNVSGLNSNGGAFTVYPSISSLSSTSGAVGASVTTTGANFGATQGTSTVSFNGTTATVASWSATSIVATVPAGATTGNVVVNVSGLNSNGVAFTVYPSISALSATSEAVGASVTITGANFGATQGTSTVSFNGTTATVASWSARSIVATVPAGATTGNVVVSVGGLASNGVPFTILPRASITNLSTTSATIGTLVTITGTNFGATQGASTVTFNGTSGTPASWSTTSIVVPVPVGATTGNVLVTVNGAPSNPVSMTVVLVSLPPVSQVRPANGTSGFPENGRIIVRFAQPLQPSALTPGTISIAQGTNNVVGAMALSNDGLAVTFEPAQSLPASSTFTVAVTDLTGNQTTPEFQSTFTTGSTTDSTVPTVVQSNPLSASTGVPISAPIVLQFSKPMDPSTLTPQSFTVTDPVTGHVAGAIQVDPTGTTVSFVPQGFLAVGRTFSVSVSSTVEDYAGNSVSGSGTSFNFATSFTADTTAPQMLSTSPSNGATAVPLNALIILEFSKPIDVISVSGLLVESGGQPVPGAIALSNSNQQVTFTPLGGLAPNTTYTVVTTSGITDVGGLALANPTTFSLTTGTSTDETTPSVVSVNPVASQTEVPLNAALQLQFSKPVLPWTATPLTFQVTTVASSLVTGTVSVSTDGLTATFTPSQQLASFTPYYVQATSGITDAEGNGLRPFESYFLSGSTTDTNALTVLTVSPANGANNIPANVRVDIMVSGALSAASVENGAVVVSAGGNPVSGTVSVSSSGTILTFVPASLLAVNTAYAVTVSGFADQAGNPVVPFSSSFTTGTSAVANTTTPTVVRVSPANGAAAVLSTTPIVLTFNEAIDGTTLSEANLPISVSGSNGVLAGSYTLDATGTVVTFTPISPLPGNSTIVVQVGSGVSDLSGNGANSFYSSFNTGTGTDTTVPTVTMVTPQNGAAGIGPNAVVVLTFSKSLNPGTINTNNFGLLANGNSLGIRISTSPDNRVVTLSAYYGIPVSSTITILATSGVTDLSGNSLASFESQFTTGPSFNVPVVVSQRPGNGATGVPLNESVVLYMSEAMNASSVQAALQVSQNGILVNGTKQVTGNGQVVEFTPSAQWQAGALVQIFLSPSAQNTSGIGVSNYQASFTIVPDSTTTAPTLIGTNPTTQVTGVPTNVIIDFAFNEPLDPTALLPDTVTCFQNRTWFQTGLSLLNGGTLLQVTPRLPLAPNSAINCQLGNGIQGVSGLALSNFSSSALSFNTGTGPDTVVPTTLTTSPPNGSSNVGDNAAVQVVFSKPVNPLTVNAGSILLSGGGTVLVPGSITFTNNNQSVVVTPQMPLLDGTQMTLTISGVTDVAGNMMPVQTTQFTTRIGPDIVPPTVVMENPFQGAQNVPLNTLVVIQMSQPVDPGTVNSGTLALVNTSTGQTVPGSYSVSADGLTISFLPAAPLTANSPYSVNFLGAGFGTGIADLAGNSLQGTQAIGFTTGTTSSTSTPQVIGVSPANGATAVPINAQVVIQFNEAVNAAQLSGVILSAGNSAVNVSPSLSSGNQRLTLIPAVPLSPSTSYTLNITGVQDLSGNLMPSSTLSFATGTGADLSPATVAVVTPANSSTGVAANTAVTVTFSKGIDPLTVTTGTMLLIPLSTNIPVSGIVSSTGAAATFTPNQPLDLLTQYMVQLTGGVTDMEGQGLYGGGTFSSYFTTGQGVPAQPPVIVSMAPSATFVGTQVTINGSYFGTSQGSSTVSFNGVPATPTNWTDTQIFVPVPNGATSGPVVVSVNGAASNGFTFNVDATPVVTSISPDSAAAGTVLTITGTNLGDAHDSIYINFNGTTVPASSANENSLLVTVPAAASPGTFNLTVSVNSYSSAGTSFTVIPTPTVQLVNPNVGVSGTPVNISGNFFGDTQGISTVTFNGVPAASITSWSNGSIYAVPPNNQTTGPVVVTVNSVPSASNAAFTVTNPTIGSVTPAAAAPGSIVVINGSNFQPQGSQNFQVLFNGVPSQSVGCTAYYCYLETVPYGSLTAQVPNGATSGPVTVVIGNITSNSVNFTVQQEPSITSVSPSAGPYASNGTIQPVTITGVGFGATQGSTTVNFFGSNTAPTILSWSDSSITLSVPPDAATGPLSVQLGGGLSATAPTWFTVNTLTQLTDSFGDQSHYSLTAQGGSWFPTASQGPGCSSCTMRGNITNTPDAYSNTLSSTDDLGNTTSYTYDSNNNLASVSKPLNPTATASTSYTYNSFGEVLTSTDPLGNTTTNTYDPHGNLLTVTSPAPNGNTAASVTQFQYNGLGELTQITDPKGNITTLTYTSVGLIATIKDAQQNITTYGYDVRGNRTSVIDPVNGSAHPTTFAYDLMNRLTGITYPDGSTVGFTYDVRGRRITSTDQNNKTTAYTYDDADRLTAVTDPATNITQYAYDTENNLLSITDANNHTTSFAYNARGWVTQTTFPSTLAEYYAYDLVGNLLSKTDRKSNTIQYVYDALYRLSSKTYPDTTNVEYTYDLANKVLQVGDPTGTYGFAYDNMGRLISTTTNYTFVAGTYTNSYGYDAASNRTSLTAPDGSISTYGYDTLNRLNGLANSWAGSFGFSYDALSRRTQLTRPNGVNTNYGYDSVSHLLSVLHQAGVNTLDGASYTYDAGGNRSSKTNYLNGVTSNYGYDPLYEVTQVTQGASTTESYSYDAVGNRLSSSGVASYSYNASNELTANSMGSYSYDANGNTLSDPSGKSYTWDFENRLIQAVVPGTNGGTTTFKYDPFGRRIQKSGPLGTTNYLYDGPNSVEEVDNSGNVLARYTNQMRVDEPLSELRSGTTSYYQQDGLESVTSLSNGSGALANSYAFDSYGKLTASNGTVTNPFQYTGREADQETGLYYYRARYYDQNIGRFISEDPIGLKEGPNFYDYVTNNPLNFVDPRGLAKSIPYRWRPCDATEAAECKKSCEARGSEFESCAVSQTYRIIRLFNGPQWVDGPVSCSCKDPNDEDCPLKKLSPNPNTVKVLTWTTIGGWTVYVISEGWPVLVPLL